LVRRKIIKIVASRCRILKLKCTKFDFGWDSAPDPTGGAYIAPPDLLAVFKGHTSEGRRGGRTGGKGKGCGRRDGTGPNSKPSGGEGGKVRGGLASQS